MEELEFEPNPPTPLLVFILGPTKTHCLNPLTSSSCLWSKFKPSFISPPLPMVAVLGSTMLLQRCSYWSPWNLWICCVTVMLWVWLRLEMSRWPWIIMVCLMCSQGPLRWKGEAGVKVRERLDDALLLVLKMEEGAPNRGIQATSKSWKSQENRFSPRVSTRKLTLQALWF